MTHSACFFVHHGSSDSLKGCLGGLHKNFERGQLHIYGDIVARIPDKLLRNKHSEFSYNLKLDEVSDQGKNLVRTSVKHGWH